MGVLDKFRRKGNPDDLQEEAESHNDSFYEESTEVIEERVPRVIEPTAKPLYVRTYDKGGFPVTVVKTGWKPAAHPLDKGTTGMLTVVGQRIPFAGGTIVPMPPKSTLEIVDRQARVLKFHFFVSVETTPEANPEVQGKKELASFDSALRVTQDAAVETEKQIGKELGRERRKALQDTVGELAEFRNLIQKMMGKAAQASVRIEIHVAVSAHVSDGTNDRSFTPDCILDFFLGIKDPTDYCRNLSIKVIQGIIDRRNLYAEGVIKGNRELLENELTEALAEDLIRFNILVDWTSVTRIEYEQDYQNRLEAIAQITKEAQANLQATAARIQSIVLEAEAEKQAVVLRGEGQSLVAQMIAEKIEGLSPEAQAIMIAALLQPGAGLNIFTSVPGSMVDQYVLTQETRKRK